MKRIAGRRRKRAGIVVALSVLFLPNMINAKDHWYEVKSPHFIVVSNAREDVALEVARQFEQIRNAFQKALPRARTGESRQLILAVKNEKSLKELLPEFWERKNGFRPDGIFRESGYHRTIVLRVDGQGPEAFSLIYHEYFHLLVNLNAPGLPSWLNEGLASYWQNTTFRDDKIIAGQPSGRYIRLLSREEPLALEEVFTSYPASHDDRASMFYAQSWALTHYLLIGDREARAHLLKQYISLVTEGSGSLEAARLAFGDLEELESKLREYTRRPLFNAVGIRASAEADPSTFRGREISEAESLALRGHFLALGGSPDRGERLLKKALRKRPGPPVAYEGMGWLALRRGDREVAETWFERAASSPGATHVAHYMSAIAKENTSEKEARFLEAISLDRAFAPAYVGLAYYYAGIDSTLQRPLAMARAAAEYDPSSAVNRLLMARVLYKLGNREEARDNAGAAASLSIWSRNANTGNYVCWFGSLTGFANDVMEACEFAVEQ